MPVQFGMKPGAGPSKSSPLTWKHAIGLLGVCGAVAVGFRVLKKNRLKEVDLKGAGKAAIGGPFTLVDTNGLPVTDHDFKGRWLLM